MHLVVEDRARAIGKEVAGLTRMGVEVGVYKGNLSSRLLKADPNLLLFMVDPWKAAAYRDDTDEYSKLTQEYWDEIMEMAFLAVSPFKERAQVIRKSSVEAAEMFDDRSLDFVFLDADHSYDAVAVDIEHWWPKVRIGGLLCGHDYRDDKHPGVKRAVHEFIGTKREMRLGDNYTWFVTKWD